MATQDSFTLPGSDRRLPPGTRRTGDTDPAQSVTVSVLVRGKKDAPAVDSAPPEGQDGSLAGRQAQRAAYADEFGASQADLDQVAGFAADHGLEVVTSDTARRTVSLRGSVAAMSEAFQVTLADYQTGDVRFRGREGAVALPKSLMNIVTAVVGLDNRPQAKAHFVVGEELDDHELPDPAEDAHQRVAALATARKKGKAVPLWATHVAQLYNFPTMDAHGNALDGAGQTIAILELGGGYRDSDLNAYFTKAGVARPNVTAVPVGEGANSPGGDADGEVLLDIELAGSIAPAAEIVVYFGDGRSDRGFLDALTTAIHDQTYAASIISISWGGPEIAWTGQAAAEFERALTDAAALGVTVLVASGDHGAGDAAGDGMAHADFPAASPHVVACGGTTLIGSTSGIVSEVVWNDKNGWAGGGGISGLYPVPTYQHYAAVPPSLEGGRRGRGVPDIAGNADLTSGYIVRIDRKWMPVGGTSAVAPLTAGLVALLNQALGHPVGYLTPQLYGLTTHPGVFRDITIGDNTTPTTSDFGPGVAGYQASAHWDACTGLGSVNGQALLEVLV